MLEKIVLRWSKRMTRILANEPRGDMIFFRGVLDESDIPLFVNDCSDYIKKKRPFVINLDFLYSNDDVKPLFLGALIDVYNSCKEKKFAICYPSEKSQLYWPIWDSFCGLIPIYTSDYDISDLTSQSSSSLSF